VKNLRKIVEADEGEVYDIELSSDLLAENLRLAKENLNLLKKHNIKSIDVMGSIGSGKTLLIEQLVQKLRGKYRIAVIGGDLTTTIDTDRIAKHGVEVVQINTGKECHLDANLVRKALKKIELEELNLIIIENVGNLICPAEFPLGSETRVVVISVTEGPFMVVKHPFIFMEADLVLINKIDLAEAMEVDVLRLEQDVKSINPKSKIVKTNCRSGYGIEETIKALGL
jgi:hydrogenase nickel incorporation protein HypB